MTVGIDDCDFIMMDCFPGPVTHGPNPSSWTAYSTTAAFELGTKRAVYCSTNKGWATLMYAQIEGGAEGDANGGAVKAQLGIDTVQAAAGKSYVLQIDGGEMLLNGPIAILLGTITGTQFTAADMYGWVWVGGVCPVSVISGLDGTFKTDGNVAIGIGIDLMDNNGPAEFGLLAAADVGVVGAFALASDANVA